jgi:GxxExxY protein
MENQITYKEESYAIIGACLEVHKELGPGFFEAVYQEALAIEFVRLQIPFIQQQELTINYKNQILNKKYYADFVCYDKIIIEIKALSQLTKEHQAQVLNYLKATNFNLGILINFGEISLNYKRLIK